MMHLGREKNKSEVFEICRVALSRNLGDDKGQISIFQRPDLNLGAQRAKKKPRSGFFFRELVKKSVIKDAME